MNVSNVILTIAVALTPFFASTGYAAPKEVKKEVPPITHTVTMEVDGMSCGSCVQGLENAFKREDGVVSAKVDFKKKRATVTFDPQMQSAVAFVNLVNRSGEYTTSPRPLRLRATAHLIHRLDPRETGRVGHALKALKGIDDVAMASKDLAITFNPNLVDAKKIVAAIKSAGLEVDLPLSSSKASATAG